MVHVTSVFLIVFAVLVVAGVSYALNMRRARVARLKALARKYTDSDVVKALADKKIWIGMTSEQLIESWGKPQRIREYSSISDLIYEYKYTTVRGNQFPARVTVANDTVTDWVESSRPGLLQRLGLASPKHRRPLA